MLKRKLWKQNLRRLFLELKQNGEISSQAKFAERLGTSPQQMSRVLDVDNGAVPSSSMMKLATEAFLLHPDYFNKDDSVTGDDIKKLLIEVLKSPNELIDYKNKEIDQLKAEILQLRSEKQRLKSQLKNQ